MARATVPPGPRGHWLTGHLPDFRKQRLDFLTRCAREYGDVVALRFGPRRVYLMSHPDLIEEVLVNQARHFIKHFALRLNPLVFGQGLLTSEGDFWLRQRRLIQPAFQKSRIAGYAGQMVDATERLLKGWEAGQEIDVLREMMQLTLGITARALFDADVGADAAEVGDALQVLQGSFLQRFSSLLPLPLYIPTPRNLRLRRAIRRLDTILYRMIRQRRAAHGEAQGDLLSLLLHARDEASQTGMTDRQLRDEAMTLFLAGHETTALTLAWTWYLLATHPQVQDRLHAEVSGVLGGRRPTPDDLPHLPYLEAIVLESLRLYSPAYVIGREVATPCEVGGYSLPRGLTVLMSQWIVHRDPRFYPDPEAFRPERWTEGLAQTLPKLAYFPFGAGPRRCIGDTFARMEVMLVLARLCPEVRFTVRPDVPVTPAPTFTLHPSPGIFTVLERR